MDTFDAPAWLKPCAATVTLHRLAQTFRSPFGGSPQVGDILSERWGYSLIIPPALLADSGAAESLAMRLAGGVNRIRLPHPIRPRPRGEFSGEPVLYDDAAAGTNTIQIVGAIGRNLCLRSGFEQDANDDGLSDGWTSTSQGDVTGYTKTRVAGHGSTYAQRLAVTTLGMTTSDIAWIYRNVPVDDAPIDPMVCAVDFRCSSNAHFTLKCNLLDSSLNVHVQRSGTILGTASWGRYSLEITGMPEYIAYVQIQLRLGDSTNGGAAWLEVNNVQLEAGSDPTDHVYAGGLLRAGDIIGLNGQWLQAAEDAYAASNGVLTVTTVNRLRDDVAEDAEVLYDAPTIEFAATGGSHSAGYGIGIGEAIALDLEEVWG